MKKLLFLFMFTTACTNPSGPNLASPVPVISDADRASGGGELLKDSLNPWFVHNTAQVSYCVKQDTANFHQSPKVIRQQIKKAIAYWQTEISRAHLPNNNDVNGNPRYVRLATQTFVETDCSEQTDIVFQFGILSGDQLGLIKDISKVVGSTVRVSYDRIHLKGKGYIYLAADSGPLKLSGHSLAAQPWSMGGGHLIHLALAHELGHVFGVPHTPGSSGVAAEGFLEYLLDAGTAQFYCDLSIEPGSVFKFDTKKDFSGLNIGIGSIPHPKNDAIIRRFFNILADYGFLQYLFQREKFELRGYKGGNPKPDLLGTGAITSPGQTIQSNEFIHVWLSDEQTVFAPYSKNKIESEEILYGPTADVRTYSGVYRSTLSRVERKIYMTFDPTYMTSLMGLMDDQLILNLFPEYP